MNQQMCVEVRMDKELLDLYTDYLITQNGYASATGLSDLVDRLVSHDKVTRFLNKYEYGSQELWHIVKPVVRKYEDDDGVLILDDSIEEKPYSKENEIVCWHYSHAKGIHLKGINFLSCMVHYNNISLPICYEVVHKDLHYFDEKEQRKRRKASIGKNEHFRNLLLTCRKNDIKYKYVLADNWFSSKENIEFIDKTLHKYFILGLKSNRTVALSISDKKNNKYTKISELNLREGLLIKAYLKGIRKPVMLMKKIFKNENGSTGTLYLISNDFNLSYDRMYEIYQKRWNIEVFHKSVKNNASLAKSPTKIVKSQKNHIFASIVAYVKLETIRIATSLNHFALKYKLILKANKNSMDELYNIRKKYGCA